MLNNNFFTFLQIAIYSSKHKAQQSDNIGLGEKNLQKRNLIFLTITHQTFQIGFHRIFVLSKTM
ncbi:hypothetical protein SAMN04488541_106012 [Thermoflexibacter ruber]|uniref:Uncharacterized protein n=1 Tax=Thermoflexibacter ruber TaxID=1003 RepID=A0A1I2JPD3_9BACT|nr:hypothetical protein SAMN04488541_106012 [Thermoflexibacter ruber]